MDAFRARRPVATLVGVVAIVVAYGSPDLRDSRFAARAGRVSDATGALQPGVQLPFTATAYCKGEVTAAGTAARTGIAAADPAILPLGSVVRIDQREPRYSGIWTVLDTGPAVRGREVDLYLWSCVEAIAFGRRPVRVTVLRLGWNPRDSAPGPVHRLLLQRESTSTGPSASPAPGPAPTPDPRPEPQ